MNKQLFWNTLLFTFTLGLAFSAGFVTHDFIDSRSGEFLLLRESLEILETHALDPLPEQKELEYGMIQGMLQAYGDPFTIFVPPPQHELQTNQLNGTFGGIGAKIERGEEGSFLLYPFLDGPAMKAGVLNGDQLVAVDDLFVSPETTMESVEAAIRGPVGKRVKIVIARLPEGQEHSFSVKREEIAIPSVIWHPVVGAPEAGLLQVTIIAQTTPDEILRAVEALQGMGVRYFILDLRGNGGGLLDAGIDIARLFLHEGIVIEQQYRGEEAEKFSATRPGPLEDIPLAVLVDRNTASAAEIVAGALQANDRAILVGEPTYGKDTVQLVFQLQDGSSLHVTSAHWWFPGLEFPTEGAGLNPTVVGAGDEDWVQTAVSLLQTP
jgi:carboxyl-terminal processing protease